MVEPVRFLIRISNEKGYLPSHVKALTKELRQSISGLDMRIGGLRISTRAIEFDLFTSNELLDRIVPLTSSYGSLLSTKRLEHEVGTESIDDTVSTAKNYFNEERFWECHELLEGIWKQSTGDEQMLLQGVILVAAAFVHVQRDEPEICISMLKRALPMLTKKDQYYSLDIKRFTRSVKTVVNSKKPVLIRL